MATNVEIKAAVSDPARLRERVEALSDTPGEVIPQEDTFFATGKGRLKLRVLSPDRGELIYYERSDDRGPKRSDYLISRTPDPDTLEVLLAAALGVRGVVRKTRRLYIVGNTRIHLDEVEGLGAFLELEVVLAHDETPEEGEAVAAGLMKELGIAEDALLEGAYIDLLEAKSAS